MKLYHGTNTDFLTIDLEKCHPYKDFGKGFYLTTIHSQAMDRAIDKCNTLKRGTPIVQTYEFDEQQSEILKIKRFSSTDEDWARFILGNRNRKNKNSHDYDIVIGPVADDGVISSIFLYETGVIDMNTLIERLKYARPNVQYCFCTKKSLELLKRL
ncbi:MAG: DUF3990 domain-containing protein [Bacteroidales bacterium]|nr:DUF3990 domain-containing protein [Bacteroidales bacterium]